MFEIAASDGLADENGLTKERVRQITRRATKVIAELAAKNPRFSGMAEYARPLSGATAATRSATPLLIDAAAPHNRLGRVAERTPPARVAGLRPDALAAHAAIELASAARPEAPSTEAIH